MRLSKISVVFVAAMSVLYLTSASTENKAQNAVSHSYALNDTGQTKSYDEHGNVINPQSGDSLYGQDANYGNNAMRFKNNGDGTVTDLTTGLIWQKKFADPMTFEEALDYAENLSLAGKNDWRLPTIKQLLSIADFRGGVPTMTPYIYTNYFDFEYPDTSTGVRIIDAQYWSSNKYTGLTMNVDTSAFGFNFADGRIKSYPLTKNNYVRCVRGNPSYGVNDFVDNGNGTVTDRATGLMWMQDDSGSTMNWPEALDYAEDFSFAGYSDWRLPNAKELQSIVDYSKSPEAINAADRGPAIDTNFFNLTEVESYFWSSTSHGDGSFAEAAYVCFGRGMSANWQGSPADVHGAGALRCDPKTGDPDDYTGGRGPQGDDVRIYNYVRLVRDADETTDVSIDLSCVKTKASSKNAEPGDELIVRTKIRNKSKKKSLPMNINLYLSSSRSVNKSAILLSNTSAGSIGAKRKVWVTQSVELPNSLQDDDYYIVSEVEGNVNNDPNTKNNTSATKIFIL